jgi:cytochrome P450
MELSRSRQKAMQLCRFLNLCSSVVSHVLTFTSMAGSDTTAAAITAILYHLMRTPAAYTTLTAEIDEAAQASLLSPVIQYHEAVGLPYLMAYCKEGIRLHPSIGLTLPRHVPKGGCLIAGKWFPAGTRVGMNAAVVQRNKDVFGEDADEFVPERWLGPDAARMGRYMLQVLLPNSPASSKYLHAW